MIIVTERLREYFKDYTGEVRFLDDSPFLSALSYHTDLRLFICKKDIVCAPSLFEKMKGLLPERYNLTCGKKEPKTGYPKDCIYNGISLGNFVFYNPDCIADEIKETASKYDLTPVEVKQGYCRCNICAVNEEPGSEAIITEDMGIHKSASQMGIKSLLIEKGEISLPGFKYGFIGGNTVTTDGDIIFFGEISKHKKYSLIKSFIREYSKKDIVILKCPELIDCGGGLFVP